MASKNSIIAAGADGWMFRNRIINGDFRIDQRFEGANQLPSSATYIMDRWALVCSTASLLYCGGINTSVSTLTQAAGTYSAGFIAGTSTAHTAAASDNFALQQVIEGINIADLQWGTSAAKPVTLSFWVYSALAGTFGLSVLNAPGSGNYSYIIPYTITTANTPQYFSFTIPGPTFGTWNNTLTTPGLYIRFDFGSGTSYQTSTTNSWVSGTYVTSPGCISLVNGAQAGKNFYVTGVQFEVGNIATPFENRSYGIELLLCQRYFEKSYRAGFVPGSTSTGFQNAWAIYMTGLNSGYNNIISTCFFKVPKMVPPSIVFYDPSTGNVGVRDAPSGNTYGSTTSASTPGVFNLTPSTASVYMQFISPTSTAAGFQAHWTASAEL